MRTKVDFFRDKMIWLTKYAPTNSSNHISLISVWAHTFQKHFLHGFLKLITEKRCPNIFILRNLNFIAVLSILRSLLNFSFFLSMASYFESLSFIKKLAFRLRVFQLYLYMVELKIKARNSLLKYNLFTASKKYICRKSILLKHLVFTNPHFQMNGCFSKCRKYEKFHNKHHHLSPFLHSPPTQL